MKQIITTSLTLIFVMLAGAGSTEDNLRLCENEFWSTAPTLADVKAEIDKGARLDGVCHLDSTPLHWAAHFGTPEIIHLLVSAGADINAFDNYFGYAPIHTALTKSVANLKALIDAGADINFRAKAYRFEDKHTGLTVLHIAAGVLDVKMVSILLQAGADIEDRGVGQTPLHSAVDASNIKTTRFLLAKGANIKAKTDKGETPLHLAVKGSPILTEMVNLLLDAGVDAQARDLSGRTAFDYVKNDKAWLANVPTYKRLRQASQGR